MARNGLGTCQISKYPYIPILPSDPIASLNAFLAGQ